MHITKYATTSLALVAAAMIGITGTALAKDHGGKVKVEGFTGVPTELTREAGNIAGINGGGLAWAIGEAEVSVKSAGKIEVEFEDLVFAAGPNTGKNTVASMAVAVSCSSTADVRTVAVSAPFAVTVADAADPVGGDADTRSTIALPETCLAPIVFITNATGTAWFAVASL